MPMLLEDVLELLDLFEAVGIEIWLDGGWGVDALLGQQTREHADLDIALRYQDEARLRTTLHEHGFREVSAEPHNPVFRDHAGGLLDVHFFDVDETTIGADGREMCGPRGLAYEVEGLRGEATIAGHRVRCLTPEYQVRSHAAGYEPDDDDYKDVLALHHRFAIPLPTIYANYPDR